MFLLRDLSGKHRNDEGICLPFLKWEYKFTFSNYKLQQSTTMKSKYNEDSHLDNVLCNLYVDVPFKCWTGFKDSIDVIIRKSY